MWWHMPATLAPGRLRQEDHHESEANLDHIVIQGQPELTRPCLKKRKEKKVGEGATLIIPVTQEAEARGS